MPDAQAHAQRGDAEPVRSGLGRFAAPFLLSALVAGVFVAASDASAAWIVLVVLGCGTFAAAFWFGDLRRFALLLFVVTLPIDISKALIVPGGVYSPGLSLYVSDIFFLALFVLWVLDRLLVGREPFRFDGLRWTALCFLAWLWLSALHSQDPLAGILAAVTYTKFFIAFLMFSDLIRRPEDMRLALTGFFCGFLLQLAYIAAQVASGSALELQGAKVTHLGTELVFEEAGGMHAFRPSGFLHHPNVLADYLDGLLPIAIAIVLLGKKTAGVRYWYGALLTALAGTGVLVITLSRGGWISFVVAMLVLLGAGLRRGLVRRRQVMAVAAAAVLGCAAVAVVYPSALLRITQSDQRSSESRWIMIDQALLIVGSNPVFGVGFGGYNRAAQNYTPASFARVSGYFQDEIRKGVVHNKYLLVAAEMGLVGLFLFLHLLWRAFRMLFPVSAWRTPWSFALALGFSAAIAGQAAFYMFDHFYADIRVELLWILLGLFHALHRGRRDWARLSSKAS